jgi:phosphohistidine phosphatase SixA
LALTNVEIDPPKADEGTLQASTLTFDIENVSDARTPVSLELRRSGEAEAVSKVGLHASDAEGTPVNASRREHHPERTAFEFTPESSPAGDRISVTATQGIRYPAVDSVATETVRVRVSDDSDGEASETLRVTIRNADENGGTSERTSGRDRRSDQTIGLNDFSPRRPGLDEMIPDLREGGYVLYFRHAKTGSGKDQFVTSPDESRAVDIVTREPFDFTDCARQRNLSVAGRRQSMKVGEAVERLDIPVGSVLASSLCRCVDTAELMFGRVEPIDALNYALGNGGDALRLTTTPPESGTNKALVAHSLDTVGLSETMAYGSNISEGSMMVIDPVPALEDAVVRFITSDELIEYAQDYG